MHIDFPRINIESGTKSIFIFRFILSFIPSEYDFKLEFKSSKTTCYQRNTPKLVVLFLAD